VLTLKEVRQRVRDRADIEFETKRYPNEVLNQYIDDSYGQFYGWLVSNSLVKPEKEYVIPTNTALTYPLPLDYYSCIKVDCDGIVLTRHKVREYNKNNFRLTYRIFELNGVRTIEFNREPYGEITFLYVPLPGHLKDDSDSVNLPLGWWEYVIIDAAIKAKRKENTNTFDLERDRKRIKQEIFKQNDDVEGSETMGVTIINPWRYSWRYPGI